MQSYKAGTHCFVYWKDEDAGSVVAISSVEKKLVVAGMTSNVRIKGKNHFGKIALVD